MNEIQESDKKNLDKIKQMLDYLYDIDMLNYMLDDELFYHLLDELNEKYVIDIDPEHSFSDDSEEIKAINTIVERYGEDYILAVKDGGYILLSLSMIEDDTRYWDMSKIDTDNLETARKVVFLIELLDHIESVMMNKKDVFIKDSF